MKDAVMSTQLLDGKVLAGNLKESLKKEVEKLKQTTGAVPHLVNVMVGNDPSAGAYANSQKKIAGPVDV